MEKMEKIDNGLIAIILAILSFVPQIISVLRQINKDKSATIKETAEAEKAQKESDDIAVKTALSLLEPLKQRVFDLEAQLRDVGEKLLSLESILLEKDNRIAHLEKREKELKDENAKMKVQIKNLQSQLTKINDKYSGSCITDNSK